MNGLKVITTKPEKVEKEIDLLLSLAKKDIHNRHKQNYEKNIFLEGCLAVSIVYENDIPFCISTIQKRDTFNGMIRILSRFYHYSNKRIGIRPPNMNNKYFCRPSTKEMINQQTMFCCTYNFNNFFFSRQDRSKLVLKNFTKGINKIVDQPGWKYNGKKYWVCNSTPENCAQYVVWKGKLCLQLYQN